MAVSKTALSGSNPDRLARNECITKMEDEFKEFLEKLESSNTDRWICTAGKNPDEEKIRKYCQKRTNCKHLAPLTLLQQKGVSEKDL